MTVDFLRSCYTSSWFLFRDTPSLETEGRYYFSDADAACYPGWHNLGSRVWQDKNWRRGQGLGESVDAPQKWDRGDPPADPPSGVLHAGDASCIERGELVSDALKYDDTRNGFPAMCFLPPQPTVTTFDQASAYSSCSVQALYARCIGWLYTSDFDSIRDVLGSFLGPEATIFTTEGGGLFPQVAIADHVDYTVVVVAGTASFQQLALQALEGLVPPQDFGNVKTMALWYACSQYLHDALTALPVDPLKPIFFAGHSYGAAGCLVLANRYRQWNPNRQIRFLTYGCPKPGDDVFRAIAGTMNGVNLNNDGDLVPALPPNLSQVIPVIAILGNNGLLVWDFWKGTPLPTLLRDDGSLEEGGEIFLDTATVLGLALAVLGGLPIDRIAAHAIEQYFVRTVRRCPNAEWPVKPAVWAKVIALDGDAILLEVGDPILDENVGVVKLEAKIIEDAILLEVGDPILDEHGGVVKPEDAVAVDAVLLEVGDPILTETTGVVMVE